ncbi:hypothetical protein [Nocardioides litoris]|uniref:hypothetical protein n=1 Tax=Nocardioides litoris TaxID=1926648 RepID=UPI0011218838|nr:hypothetical protein [Nocardioides litoris]
MTTDVTRPDLAVTDRPDAGTPRTHPGAGGVTVLVCLLLAGLAALGVQDLLASQGWTAGEPWLLTAVDAVDGLAVGAATTAAGVVLVVLGLAVLLLAVRRGRPTHLRTSASAETWVSPRALGALAARAADRAPGVLHTSVVRSTRRSVVVEVGTRSGPGAPADPGALDAARTAASAQVELVPGARLSVRQAKDAS